jgi:hypothetical protein
VQVAAVDMAEVEAALVARVAVALAVPPPPPLVLQILAAVVVPRRMVALVVPVS